MIKEKCSDRLQQALYIRRMNQTQLCEMTGIPKSAMSQYVNGGFEPKYNRLELISKALEVNEAWLMGYNVPMERMSSKQPGEMGYGYVQHTDVMNQKALEETANRSTDRYEEASGKYPPAHELPLYSGTSSEHAADADAQTKAPPTADQDGEPIYFKLIAADDSMNAARIYPGDILIVRRQESVNNGEIAVIAVNGKLVVRRFRTENQMILLEPQSSDSSYGVHLYEQDNPTVTVLGKVVKVEFDLE